MGSPVSEACLGVADLEQPGERVDPTAEPAAAKPVEHGIKDRRQHVAGNDHITIRNRDVDVAVGVRLDEVAVVDVATANLN